MEPLIPDLTAEHIAHDHAISAAAARNRAGRRKRTIVFHTIGYEMASVPEFIARLRAHRVSLVVDVRDLPLSRRKGFSKNQIREHLATAGIDYEHLRALGAPKALRHGLREGGSWGTYVVGYRRVLAANQESIAALRDQATRERICLLCYERRPEECHRSLVAAEVEGGSRGSRFKVEHIRY